MKMYRLLIVFLFLIIAGPIWAFQQAPKEIAGFVLGKNIELFEDVLKMDSALPIRFAPFLEEVETKKLKGFKSGLINFGNCETPGVIIRIKLKYEDSSEKFYKRLLNRIKERFGEPDEWRGDPFHLMVAWKWSFVSKDGERTTLTLQHNTKDSSEKLGNSIKIARLDLEMAERRCYEQKQPGYMKSKKGHQKKSLIQDQDWEWYLPR
jgi:hypothetical protein